MQTILMTTATMPRSQLFVKNELHELAPHHGGIQASTLSALTAPASWAMAHVGSTDEAWEAVGQRAAAARQLHVAIIGSSVTAGCGSNDPRPHCHVDRSWVRWMHDALTVALSPSVSMRTNVYAKNAVSLNFFCYCTAEYVPADADVVLLEVQMNLFEYPQNNDAMTRGLAAVVRAVQRVAPSAVPVFVNWQKPDWLARWRGSPQEGATRAVALALGADILDPWPVLRTNVTGWFAHQHNGRLDHHPNLAGHQLLGLLAAWYVERRLSAATQLWAAAPSSSAMAAEAPWQRIDGDGGGGGGARARTGKLNRTRLSGGAEVPIEVCYQRADKLPLSAVSRGWRLLDEGGNKGVQKLGYVSEAVGDRLDLSPVLPARTASDGGANAGARAGASATASTGTAVVGALRQYLGGASYGVGGGGSGSGGERRSSQCMTEFKARLGFFISSRPGQGALRLSCPGCGSCVPIKSPFMRKAFPFPLVQTDVTLNLAETGGPPEPSLFRSNVSVTGTTLFTIRNTPAQLPGCRLRVVHAPSKASRAATSRVRVDSLVLYAISNLTGPCPGSSKAV